STTRPIRHSTPLSLSIVARPHEAGLIRSWRADSLAFVWLDPELPHVAKVALAGQTKFFRAADAFCERRRERPHRFIQNRPGTSVVALKSDTAAEKSKDQLSRDFPGRSIFDCCNNIPSEANIRARLQHVCFVPQQLTYLQTPICNRPL